MLLFCANVWGQNANLIQNSQWYFGRHVAIDFSSGSPVVNTSAYLNGTTFTKESATSVSDNLGHLIFYTDGTDVWNKNHVKLNTIASPYAPVFSTLLQTLPDPAGSSTLKLANSTFDGIISCPIPNSTNKYYLFRAPEGQNISINHNISYATIDMTANTVTNPSQDVTLNASSPMCSEQAIIIPHCNGVDYWLINYDQNKNIWSTLITRYGVASGVSNVINIPNMGTKFSIKANPNNDKIAVNDIVGDLDIINFNNATGVFGTVSTYQNLNNLVHLGAFRTFALSFNSAGDKVYMFFDNYTIYYFDLTTNLWSVNPVPNSYGNLVDPTVKMQLAPDNNIYFVNKVLTPNNLNNLSSIQNPNTSTPTISNYSLPINLNSNMDDLQGESLPQFVEGKTQTYTPPTLSYTLSPTICKTLNLNLPSCWGGYFYHIVWGDGTTSDVTANTAIINGFIIPHTYPTFASYNISVVFCQPTVTAPPYNAPSPAITVGITANLVQQDDPCNSRSATSLSNTNIPTQSFNNSTYPNGIIFTSPTIVINGNVTFSGVEVVFPNNTQIQIAAGATLTLDHSYFHGCTTTWQGMVVTGPTAKINIINNSLVEDAIKAVWYPGSTSSALAGCINLNTAIFNKNKEDVVIETYKLPSTALFPFTINNCVFTCRDLLNICTRTWPTVANLMTTATSADNLISPYTNLNSMPTTTVKGTTSNTTNHIRATNVGLTTGSLTSPVFGEWIICDLDNYFNLIDNANTGLSCENSNVWLSNCIVQNCITGINATKSITGINIANVFRLRVLPKGGNLAISPNLFFNNINACINIKDYTWNTFIGNDMRSTQNKTNYGLTSWPPTNSNTVGKNAITIDSKYLANATITYNSIYNHHNGIIINEYCKNTNPYYFNGVLDINYNTIKDKPVSSNWSAYFSDAIVVSITKKFFLPVAPYTPVPNYLNITNNTISNVYRGVHVSSFKILTQHSIVVAENIFTITPDPNTTTTGTQHGVWIDNSSNIYCKHNTVNAYSIASNVSTPYTTLKNGPVKNRESNFKFDYNLNQTITCNTSNDGMFGFEFNGGISSGNTRWINLNTMNRNYFGLLLNNAAVIGDQAVFNSSGIITNPMNNLFNTPIGSQDKQTYTFNTPLYNGATRLSGLFVNAGGLMEPTMNLAAPPTNLFIKTGATPSIYISTLASFSNCAVAPFKIPPVGTRLMSSAASLSAVLSGINYAVNSLELNYMNKWMYYGAQIADSSYITDTSTTLAFFNATNAPTNPMSKMIDIESDISNANYTAAQSKITAFNPANTIETNQKSFYNLQIKYLSNIAFTEPDKTELLRIATACPYISGSCVYDARIMYNQIALANNTDYFPFYDDCNNTGLYRKKSPVTILETENTFDVDIYPNPTKEGFYININTLDNTILLNITDITGKIVQSEKVLVYSNTGYVKTNLVAGVYFVTIKNKSNEQIIKKIVIQ